jgi:hypothetical protein
MSIHYRKFVTILILALILALVPAPVTAVKVEGAKIMYDVIPGKTYVFPMAISIKPEDDAAEYAIDVLGFGQSPDGGSYQGITADKDTGPYSARSYISFPSTTIKLDPGQRVAFNATVKVPANAGDGGRYAVVLIHPASAGTGQAAFATAVLVPVMLTVEGSNLAETGRITGIDVGEIGESKPITISTTLENTGNHHYYGAVNRVTITDRAGKTVAATTTEPFVRAVIPGQSVRVPAAVSAALPVGTYTVKSEMLLESGTVLDSSSTALTVSEAYVPPFTAANVTVTAERAATLRVPEGTVTISFPQGAVLGEATVSVAPAQGPLPDLPPGTSAGATTFTVSGLSGLLAKDATITVKYAAGDLAAAGGNAQKLALARYDRGGTGWTLLPTTTDANAKTLTAATNRFSTWAVLASDTAAASAGQPAGSTTYSPGPGPLLICGVLGFALLAWGSRRRT